MIRSLLICTVLSFYGCSKISELPIVETMTPVLDSTHVVLGGEVTFTGGDKNTVRGVCYSTSPGATTNDQVAIDANKGMGTYSININGLIPRQSYYVRAFAENKMGKVYGEEKVIKIGFGNDKGAFFNSRGCLECDNYSIGDTFLIRGYQYVVVDRNFIEQNIGQYDMKFVCTSKLTDATALFAGSPYFNDDISNWDMSNVTNMNMMFAGVVSFNRNIGSWDVSNVLDIGYLFYSATSFNQNLNSWEVNNVRAFNESFYGAQSFNSPLNNWDVGNGTNFRAMFKAASVFNHPIGDWNVSNATNMNDMFEYATNFNQNLNDWCVTNFPTIPGGFATNSGLAFGNLPLWGTCPP